MTEKQNIINLDDYCAISIDTSVFRSNGYNFNNQILSKLHLLVSEERELLISEIVYKEMERHLIKELNDHENIISTNLSKLKNLNNSITDGDVCSVKKMLMIGSGKEIINKKLEEFILTSKATILDVNNDYINISDVVFDYFNYSAPFENKKDKKCEFPDALILNSLVNYAYEKDGKILIVSADKGWENYADTSDCLVYIDKLEKVLDALHPLNIKKHLSILIRDIFKNKDNKYIDLIKFLEDEIQNIDVKIDAWTNGIEQASLEYVDGLKLKALSLSEDNDVEIISYNDNSFSISLNVNLDLSVSALFDFYSYNTIDDDYAFVNDETITQKYQLDTLINLTCTFNMSKNILDLKGIDLRFSKVELPVKKLYISFGEIERSSFFDY